VELLQIALPVIDRIGTRIASSDLSRSLLKCYSAALELVIITTRFALDRSAQLQHLLRGGSISSGALILAKQANELPIGLQLLEHARGVIWSQTLHMRDIHLEDVPMELGTKLKSLAHSLRTNPQPLLHFNAGSGQEQPFLQPRDLLYEQRSQLQQTLSEIRALPGLSSFMEGQDYQALIATAARSPVVVLVADVTQCHALIIPSPQNPLIYLALPNIDARTLQKSAFTGERSRKRGLSFDSEEDHRLALGSYRGPSSPIRDPRCPPAYKSSGRVVRGAPTSSPRLTPPTLILTMRFITLAVVAAFLGLAAASPEAKLVPETPCCPCPHSTSGTCALACCYGP
jgi:hypothetical protein